MFFLWITLSAAAGEETTPGGGGVVVSLLGWNYHAEIDPVQILQQIPPRTWTFWLGKFTRLCLLKTLVWLLENPCELLVSPTFGSFCRLGSVEMIEFVWALTHTYRLLWKICEVFPRVASTKSTRGKRSRTSYFGRFQFGTHILGGANDCRWSTRQACFWECLSLVGPLRCHDHFYHAELCLFMLNLCHRCIEINYGDMVGLMT